MAKQGMELTSQHLHHCTWAFYGAGPKADELEKGEIYKMRHMNVIDLVKLMQESLIVFAARKDGSLRSDIDERMLNAVMLRDVYLIRRIKECLDSFSEVALFSKLDASFGYSQIGFDDWDKDKTMFTL